MRIKYARSVVICFDLFKDARANLLREHDAKKFLIRQQEGIQNLQLHDRCA